jgi:DNA-3-methyladenine glycosylase I
VSTSADRQRCWTTADPLYDAYHDEEWGRPVRDERGLYERLCLEGFQSGLAWITILRKRENFRSAFAGFDPEKVAQFGEPDVKRLLGDAGIVRHRGKIEATIANARAVLAVQEELGSLDALVWSFVDGTPIVNRSDVPAETPTSRAVSKELRRRGFRFVGPTTAYAFMQAAGLADDHAAGCFRAG